MSHCKILKSTRGGDMLVLDGYSYHLNKREGNKYYWRCVKKKTAHCGVTLSTIYEDNEHKVLKQNIDHGHIPSPEKEIKLKLMTTLKERANSSMDAPTQIIQRCIQDVPTTSAPHLPNKAAMRVIIQRARNKNLPKLPTSISEVIIPEEYSKINNNQFLVGHYTYEGESVIVFSTNENMRLISSATFLIMDGTFQCCPLPFTQIYTIHAKVGTCDEVSQFLPLVFGLLSHKTEHCYRIFLELVKNYIQNHISKKLKPQIIITDFETAAINAVKSVFPKSSNKLCFFHLTQSIWRHIQSAGLAKRYGNDCVFAHKLRHLAALAFLEPAEISEAFQIVKEEIIPEEAEEVLKWFEKYYVNGSLLTVKTGSSTKLIVKHKPPQFPPHMWSVHESYISCIPMTQNSLESWHNRFNVLLNRRRWNIYQTINEFAKEQKNNECVMERVNSSEPATKKRKSGNNYNERLRAHFNNKSEMSLKSFLSGLAHICYLKT